GTVNNNIQSGQAFVIQSAGAGGTLTFKESDKAAGSKMLFRPQGIVGSEQSELRTSLYGVNPNGSTFLADGTLIQFKDTYTNALDGMDARKMGNTGEKLGIQTGGKLQTIERRHTLIQQDTIFLDLSGVRAQGYRFEFIASNLNPGL